MIYFENNRVVTFEDLRQVVNEDGKRIYSENLIQEIKSGNFNYLNTINLSDRNNEYFMEPLLFAVKNSELSTYEVYKYYGEELQKNDLTTATEIVISEPKVIENTSISDNETIMLFLAKFNPEVILYMSEDLKNDGEFIEELCKSGNKETIMYAARECNISTVIQDNPALTNNPEFMKEAIKEDGTLIACASSVLKNDHEFMKEACKENKEVINYIVEHTNEFGVEGIEAAKETLVEDTTCRAIEQMKADLEKVQQEKSNMENGKGFNENSEEYKKIKIKERQLSNNIKFINKIRNGEVKQERAVRLVNNICENMSTDYKKEFLKYIKMDDAVIEKQKVEKETLKIEPKDIEDISKESTISEINNTTQGIREDYEEAKEKEVEDEKNMGDKERT